MNSLRRQARFAGAFYLLACLPAPFVLLYVPGKIIVSGNATATARNILAHEALYELSIFLHLVQLVLFIFLPLVLYRLLSRVNRGHAAVMVILVLVSIPISLFSVLCDMGALAAVRGGDYLSVIGQTGKEALAYFLLVLRGKSLYVAQIFWGLWLVPLGLLILRSGFIPRLLGVLLLLNGAAYPIWSLSAFFLPDYAGAIESALFPALLGEVWIIAWLLIKGAKQSAPELPTATDAAAEVAVAI